ncbi:hypothetical protein CesoFtcFv8_022911 [Champsocephalus esox]|uniref:Uncharacterized protein n=1 Tax=Champsocephalus esox TaxID=159716 RepID=A0AAN8GI26_9TELE|nr:hypothetical protein CesoFtcFv8_022911 [Champsocephalus esox]
MEDEPLILALLIGQWISCWKRTVLCFSGFSTTCAGRPGNVCSNNPMVTTRGAMCPLALQGWGGGTHEVSDLLEPSNRGTAAMFKVNSCHFWSGCKNERMEGSGARHNWKQYEST